MLLVFMKKKYLKKKKESNVGVQNTKLRKKNAMLL